jgi:tetratricopeptide (TPR) repeat protein
MATDGAKPVIFVSYAHLDEPEKPVEGEARWLSFVTGHLRPAVKHGAVDIWVDTLMRGGDDWNPEIERKLRECDVFVLLVSRYSTSADYIVDKEIAIVRDRQKNREDVRFYPLLLTPTADAGLAIVRDKNLRPRGGRAFSSYLPHDRDQHMADAANEIAEIALEIAAHKIAAAPRSQPAPSQPTPTPSLAPEFFVPSSLPPNPKMIGRKDRLEELINAILEEDRPIVVPGALGMGKTTLALAAAHDSRIIARFGESRRFFVNLEPTPNAENLLTRLAAHLGLPASGAASEVEAKIAAVCSAQPTLAILDNLETPWLNDREKTEALLGRLAAIETLKLVITVRGETPVVLGGAFPLRNVPQLDQNDALTLFLRHAGQYFASDPALPRLLEALDGHPLSIELFAARAAGNDDLKGFLSDWTEARQRFPYYFERGSADDRLTSLRVSLGLSLDALGAKSAAHRLIRLMALLPDGMSEADSRTILSDGEPTREERGAAARLGTACLVSSPRGRSRLLAPVRETLLADFLPEAEDRVRLVNLFLRRASLGERAGTAEWNDVRDEVVAEAGNLDALIGLATKETLLPDGLAQAIRGLADFHCFTGLASSTSLPAALTRFQDAGDLAGVANCLESLGDIAFDRSDLERARQRYGAALPLYEKLGDVLGVADCVKGFGAIALGRSDHEEAQRHYVAALELFTNQGDALGKGACVEAFGDIALYSSDHKAARQQYEAALSLYKEVENTAGEANCIGSLGDIAFELGDYAEARSRFATALRLYKEAGDVTGEAFCIEGLGDIAFKENNLEEARQLYETALLLHQKVGSVAGEANCVQGFGSIALARPERVTARRHFGAALALYQRIGQLQGEADCMQGLADIDEGEGEIALARERWAAALALYEKIPEPKSIGETQLRLARRAATREEAVRRRQAARKAWGSIDRPDLIEEHLGRDA